MWVCGCCSQVVCHLGICCAACAQVLCVGECVFLWVLMFVSGLGILTMDLAFIKCCKVSVVFVCCWHLPIIWFCCCWICAIGEIAVLACKRGWNRRRAAREGEQRGHQLDFNKQQRTTCIHVQARCVICSQRWGMCDFPLFACALYKWHNLAVCKVAHPAWLCCFFHCAKWHAQRPKKSNYYVFFVNQIVVDQVGCPATQEVSRSAVLSPPAGPRLLCRPRLRHQPGQSAALS